MAHYITLVSVAWDSGTEYYSFQGVSLPSQHYNDRLISISPITREIPYPAGQYRISGGSIELDNTDNYFGALKYAYAFRNRVVTISIVDADTDSTLYTLWTASIKSWSIRGYALRLDLRDDSMSRLGGKLSGIIFDKTNFPNIPSDSERKFVPYAFGELSADGYSSKGLVPLKLVTTSNPFTYVIAYNRIYTIARVYVYGVLKTLNVDYTVTTDVIGGITYDTVHFTTDQRDSQRPTETEVTADIQGYDNSTIQLNPVVQVRLLLIFFGFENAVSFPASIAMTIDAHNKCYNREMDGVFYVDDNEMTGLDILDKYAESFNWSPFRAKGGQLVIYQYDIIDEIDAVSQADLSNSDDVVAQSLHIEGLSDPIGRLQANYLFNWIPEKRYFEFQPRPADEAAESEIVTPNNDNINLWCVNYVSTAETVRRTHRYLMSEGVYFVKFDLPFEHYDLELNDWVSLTANQGIGTVGFAAKKMRVIALTLLLNPLEMRIAAKCVALPPVSMQDFSSAELSIDAKRLPVVADNSALSSWPDESEYDHDLSQSTSANMPKYRTASGPDGGPCVEFDGGDYMTQSSAPSIQPAWAGFFAVFKCTATGTQTIVSVCAGGAFKYGLYAVGTSLRFTIDDKTGYAAGTIVANTWYIVSGIYSATASPTTKVYINGVVGPTTANTYSSSLSGPILSIGGEDDGSNPLIGSIVHVGLLNRQYHEVMDAERRTIEAMLSDRFGITII